VATTAQEADHVWVVDPRISELRIDVFVLIDGIAAAHTSELAEATHSELDVVGDVTAETMLVH